MNSLKDVEKNIMEGNKMFDKFVKLIILLGALFFTTAFASVPHNIGKYNFHIDLPDGFTRMVEEENISQRIYDSYHGNYKTKQAVHIRIQGQDVMEDYVGKKLEDYRDKVLAVYKQQGAKMISADIVKLPSNEALLIRSIHDGKEHLSLQIYVGQTMYSVTVAYKEGNKRDYEMFKGMMFSVKIK